MAKLLWKDIRFDERIYTPECLEGVWRVPGRCWECLEDMRKVSGGYLECVRQCLKIIWKVSGKFFKSFCQLRKFFNVLLAQFPSPHFLSKSIPIF